VDIRWIVTVVAQLTFDQMQAQYPTQASQLVADMRDLYVMTVVSGTYDDPSSQPVLKSQSVSDFYDARLSGRQPVDDAEFLVQFEQYEITDHGLRAQMASDWLAAWEDMGAHGYHYTYCFNQPQAGWCWRPS
jgi:hypothetical protein